MVRRSQKTKNRMVDEMVWMQQKCAEIEKKEGQVSVLWLVTASHWSLWGEDRGGCEQGGLPGADSAPRRQHEVNFQKSLMISSLFVFFQGWGWDNWYSVRGQGDWGQPEGELTSLSPMKSRTRSNAWVNMKQQQSFNWYALNMHLICKLA